MPILGAFEVDASRHCGGASLSGPAAHGFSVSVTGDKAMIEVWARAEPVCNGMAGMRPSVVSCYSRAHQNQIDECVAALTTGGTPRRSGYDGLQDVRSPMPVLCSAKEGVAADAGEATNRRFAGWAASLMLTIAGGCA